MKRNFDNWLTAYLDYARDGFVPEQFNVWTGLSILAGALERKVWLPWNDTFSYYPNIYVFLVSLPGIGKSTALQKGIGVLMEMNNKVEDKVKMIPSQITEAEFIHLMSSHESFSYGTRECFQSAGYYYASEASSSVKNVFGDFIACITDFYDCNSIWEKSTRKDGRVTVRNACFNLLAGSTFDYMGKIITDENILGGFASRIIYVVQRGKLIREQEWQLGGVGTKVDPARTEYRNALVEDLIQIHRMVGPFVADAEYSAAWEKWYPEYEERRQSMASEKMQSLLVRTNTNLLKVSMLLSAANADDRVLRLDHWTRAQEFVEATAKEIPHVFRSARSSQKSTQDGLNSWLMQYIEECGEAGVNFEVVKSAAVLSGSFNPMTVAATVDQLLKTGILKSAPGRTDRIVLGIDADDYF